jgi:hypothetical protein
VRAVSQPVDKDPGGLKISPEAAAAVVQKTFQDLGVKDMALINLEKAQMFPKYKAYGSNNARYPSSSGYYLVFSKSYGGIDSDISARSYLALENPDHYIYASPEWIEAYVNERGELDMFKWWGYNKSAELIHENTTLLPFEKIQEAVRKAAVPAVRQTAEDNKSDNQSFTVDALDLKTGLVAVRQKSGQALSLPCWYIRYTLKSPSQTVKGCITLNAIDGGIVFISTGLSSKEPWNVTDGIAAGTRLEQSLQK